MTRKHRIPVTLTFPDAGLPDADWIIEFDGRELRARRKGARKSTAVRCRWRTVLGIILSHLK